jgi:hypothetical protein
MPLRRDDPTGAGIMMLPWQPERRMPLTALGRVTAGDSEMNRQVQSAVGLQSALPLSARRPPLPPEAASDSESPSSELAGMRLRVTTRAPASARLGFAGSAAGAG